MLATSLGLALFSASAVAQSIVVSYPLASQYPPIARVDRLFSWTISPTTFTVDSDLGPSSRLTYAADGLPEWLNFKLVTHSFTGTPPLSAVSSPATIIVSVSASDSSVSATDSFTLVTLDSQPPYIAHPIYTQLTNPANPALSGAFQLHDNSALPPPASAGGSVPGLRLPPSWSFSIGIRGDTFLSPYRRSLFYSTSPLPPWITFNPWTYTFDGITPSTPGQQVEIVVRGSERKGYSDPSAEERFWISVASEELHLSGPASANGSLTANVTAGEAFEIRLRSVIENGSLWDGGEKRKLGSIYVDISSYSWLNFDTSSMTISGTTPTNSPDIRVPISVSDSRTPPQTVNGSFTIKVFPNFFKSLSYDLPMAFGNSLSFDLSSFVASPDSLGQARRHLIELAVTGAQSWMSFNPTNFTLTGTAPSVVRDGPVPPGLTQSPEGSVRAPLAIEHGRDVVLASSETSSVTPIKIIFSALDTDSQTTSHFTLNVLLSPAAGRITEAPPQPDKDQHSSNRGKVVALSVVFGLLLLALIVGLLFCSLKNGSLLAFCSFFKRKPKEKPLPPYFVDQRSLDGDTLAGGHYDIEKGVVGGILRKSGEGGALAAEDNRKVSFALETPRPSTDARQNRGDTSISSGSHYPDDSSGASAAIKMVGRSSMDTTTSESAANGPSPYMLVDVSNSTSHQSAGQPFLAPPAALRSNSSTPARPSIDSTSSGSHYASSGSKYPTSSNASTTSRLIHAFTTQSPSPAPSVSSPASSSSPKFSFMDRLRQFPLPSIPVPSFASTTKDENARRRMFDEGGKLVISKPRPLMPSLGARLAAEYKEQQEEAKRKIEVTRITGATIVSDSEGNGSYPTPGTSRAPSPLNKAGVSKNGADVATLPADKDKSIPFPLHQPLPSIADLGRETDAGALASSSGSSSGLSSSSSDTLGGEVPMRRSDFLSDSDKAKRSPQLSPKGSPGIGHNREPSRDSSASFTLEGTSTMGRAVISKAAVAVRSPTVAIPVVIVGNGDSSVQRNRTTNFRVVQFEEGRSVEGSSKQYSGKREQSQKAVVMDGSGSKLALKVQELRKQHAEKERANATVVKVPHHPEPLRLAPEPKDLQDPKVAMGVHYVPRNVVKFGSDENMSEASASRASAIFFTSPPSAIAMGFSPEPRQITRVESEGEMMGVALSGSEESLEARGVAAGKARIISSVPLIRSRERTAVDVPSISSRVQMHTGASGLKNSATATSHQSTKAQSRSASNISSSSTSNEETMGSSPERRVAA